MYKNGQPIVRLLCSYLCLTFCTSVFHNRQNMLKKRICVSARGPPSLRHEADGYWEYSDPRSIENDARFLRGFDAH